MIFCYHVNRFLTFCLLSEILAQQNFKEKIVPKNAIFSPNFPSPLPPPRPTEAQCRFLLEVKQMPE